MPYVERTFCCCIPVRAGVVLLSSFASIVSAVACIGDLTHILGGTGHVTTQTFVRGIVQAVVWATLTTISMFGLLGAWYKRQAWVSWFLDLMRIHCWAHAILGLVCLVVVAFGSARETAMTLCEAALSDILDMSLIEQTCFESYRDYLVVCDVVWAAGVLIELWLVMIVSHYLDILLDDAELQGIDINGPRPSLLANRRRNARRAGRAAARVDPRYSKLPEARDQEKGYAV